MKANILWLIGLVGLLSLALIHGCDQDRSAQSPAAPEGTVAQKVVLRIGGVPSKANAKVVGLRIDAAGIDEKGAQIGPVIPPVSIANPTFPQAVELTLYRPPCRYRITVTTDLSRDSARTWEDQIDICEQKAGALMIDVFESFFADQLTIQAPEMVNAGEALTVSCQAEGVNAPDSAQYPLTVTLSERGGSRFDSSPNGLAVSGAFPDPYTAAETQRVLNCAIADGRSTPQTVTKTIARILPTPIPGVTVTPVPEVTVTPTPTPIGSSTLTITKSGTGTGTVTSAPVGITCGGRCRASFKNGTRVTLTATPDTGMGFVNWSGACMGAANSCTVTMSAAQTVNVEFVNLCLVQNSNDSGTGSLRQVLVDAPTNNCSTITFAAGVTRIDLISGQLTVSSGTLTVDGGAGVKISGYLAGSRVLYINGANITLRNMTISNGDAMSGGGINLQTGSVIIDDGTVVEGNSATYGGGIYAANGTLTVRGGGIIRSNYSLGGVGSGGGGIYFTRATININVNGTVTSNSADYSGGGIYSPGDSQGTLNLDGIITNNVSNSGIGGGVNIGASAQGVATVNITSPITDRIFGNYDHASTSPCANYFYTGSGCVLP